MSEQTDGSKLLPEWFFPSNLDVIVGWARQNHQHVGNQRFREIIDRSAPHYLAARTKLEKTQVIAAVIDKIRSDSPGGGFVRKDFYSGRWYEIGDEKARDKVGHAVRKAAEQLQKQGPSSRTAAADAATQIRSVRRERAQDLPATRGLQSSRGGIQSTSLAEARAAPMTTPGGSLGHGLGLSQTELIARTQLPARRMLQSPYDPMSLLPTMQHTLPPLVYQNPYSYLASMRPLQLTQQGDLFQQTLPSAATVAALLARNQAEMASLSGVQPHQPNLVTSNAAVVDTQLGSVQPSVTPSRATFRLLDRPSDSSVQLPPVPREAPYGMASRRGVQLNPGVSAPSSAHLATVDVPRTSAHLPTILPMNISTPHISALVRLQADDDQQINRVQVALRRGRELRASTDETEISKQQSSDEEDRKVSTSKISKR